jgi:hypothetical protein
MTAKYYERSFYYLSGRSVSISGSCLFVIEGFSCAVLTSYTKYIAKIGKKTSAQTSLYLCIYINKFISNAQYTEYTSH